MKLKELREAKNLSQYEFAPLIGLKQATYANYETGKTQPTIETLCKIADFYGVSLDFLCEHETQNKQDLGYLDEKTIEMLINYKELNHENKITARACIYGLRAGQTKISE